MLQIRSRLGEAFKRSAHCGGAMFHHDAYLRGGLVWKDIGHPYHTTAANLPRIDLYCSIVVSGPRGGSLDRPGQSTKFIVKRDDRFDDNQTVRESDAPPFGDEFGIQHKARYQTCVQGANVAYCIPY